MDASLNLEGGIHFVLTYPPNETMSSPDLSKVRK